jgi:hypothetical protein
MVFVKRRREDGQVPGRISGKIGATVLVVKPAGHGLSTAFDV